MGLRRFALAWLAATISLGALASPALAKRPDAATPDERPLTREEQAASDRKVAQAERYVASLGESGRDLVPLGCVVPTSTEAGTTSDPGTERADESPGDANAPGFLDATVEESSLAPLACSVPQQFLAVEARDQIFGHYCGPAVGQVIGNYSWAVPAGANAFTQRQIAGWMSTDANGGTGAFQMEFGLENATAGSPRRPRNWDWVVTPLTDTDRDGWVGDQLDAMVRSNISNALMPLAVPVKPHDPNSPSGAYLFSWPNPVWSVGHWVAIYGYVGIYDGTDRARMYYTDSSRDEGGATGKFWTPTRWFTLMILEHTKRLVW